MSHSNISRSDSYKEAIQSKVAKAPSEAAAAPRPKISIKKKQRSLDAIRKAKTKGLRSTLFTKLTISTLESLDLKEAKNILKEKDISLVSHALTNNDDGNPRADQRTLARMILLGSLGNNNYSPASLFTHGGRIIFDCTKSTLATMQNIMVQDAKSQIIDGNKKTVSVSFIPEKAEGAYSPLDDPISTNPKGQKPEGITTRKESKLLGGKTISSHSLVNKDGRLKERKHTSIGSVARGKSSSDPEIATLFQQNLGLSTGDQTGKEGSMILVTDKGQKSFMIGIEGSSFGYGGSEITKKGHSILGTKNKVSAFNQEKGSAIQKISGFEDFPGTIDKSRIELTDSHVKEFKRIDDWLNLQSPEVRIKTLTDLMKEDNSIKRHSILKNLLETIAHSPTGESDA